MSVARILLPELKGYKEHIELELGKYLEHRVNIASMDARLIGLTPTLIFKDVHLLDKEGGKDIISFKEARLGVAILESLVQRTFVPSDFTIVDTVIAITQAADGRYVVQGVDVSALEKNVASDSPVDAELADWLFRRSNISLHDSTIIWKQKGKKGKVRRFEHVNVSLHNSDNRHQLTGEIKLPRELGKELKLALDIYGDLLNPVQWKGVFYFSGKGVRFGKSGVLPTIKKIDIKSGIADYDIWGNVNAGMVSEVSGDIALYGVALQKNGARKPYQVDVIKGMFTWQGQSDDWALNIDNFQYVVDGNVRPSSSIRTRWKKDGNTHVSSFDLGLDYCRLEDVRGFLLFSTLFDKSLQDAVSTLQPAGDVTALRFYAEHKNDQLVHYKASASAGNLSISPWKKIPGISGLTGKVNFSEQQGVLDIQSSFFVLKVPKLFRSDIYISRLEGTILWESLQDAWQIRSRDMIASNNDLRTVSDITITTSTPRQPIHLDVQVSLADMNAAAVPRYLPVGVMPKSLIEWIDHAFVGGTISKAGFIYHGKYKTPPFRGGSGVIQANFETENMTVAYNPLWPQIHAAKFNANFTDRSVKIESGTAQVYSSDMRDVALEIKSFSYPVLNMSGKVLGSMADTARFLVKSPVAPDAKPFVDTTRFEGNIETQMKLRIPLNEQVARKTPLRFSGNVVMPGNNVYMRTV